MQARKHSALEAGLNTAIGIGLNQALLFLVGVPFGTATALTAAMILLSTVRSYAIRRLFTRLS